MFHVKFCDRTEPDVKLIVSRNGRFGIKMDNVTQYFELKEDDKENLIMQILKMEKQGQALKNKYGGNVGQPIVQTAQRYREIDQKMHLAVAAVDKESHKQKQKLKPHCQVAIFIIYVGFWIFFSGFGKLGAIKRCENQIETDLTAFNTGYAKHLEAGKLICFGILVLFFSAILISFSVDVMIDNPAKTYLVKASAGAFLLLIGGFLLYTGYKCTLPSIDMLYTPASRKHQTGSDRRAPGVRDPVKITRDPVKVNLSALLQPKYILTGITILVAVFIGNHYYQASKASKEYLRYNQTELDNYRSEFDSQRKVIFRQAYFTDENLIQEVYGGCFFRSKDELIAGLDADDIDNINDITACFARRRDPAIIEPFLNWYQGQLDAGHFFSTSHMGDMSDMITAMRAKAVTPLSNALISLENETMTDLVAEILATIHTKESIQVLADTIKGNSIPSAYSAGRVIEMISCSPYIKINKSFELVSRVYNFDDSELRRIAIETLRIFKGTAPRNLATVATKDLDAEIADYASQIKEEMK